MKINSEQLEQQIQQQDITGADLARMTGLSSSTISNTRAKGSCDFVTLVKIAEALGIDIKMLIPEELLKEV